MNKKEKLIRLNALINYLKTHQIKNKPANLFSGDSLNLFTSDFKNERLIFLNKKNLI